MIVAKQKRIRSSFDTWFYYRCLYERYQYGKYVQWINVFWWIQKTFNEIYYKKHEKLYYVIIFLSGFDVLKFGLGNHSYVYLYCLHFHRMRHFSRKNTHSMKRVDLYILIKNELPWWIIIFHKYMSYHIIAWECSRYLMAVFFARGTRHDISVTSSKEFSQ